METAYATCCLCDALCGLTVQHEDGKVVAVRGQPDDVFSRGYICPKGVALPDVMNDPDRVRRPLRRTKDGFVEVPWEQALDDIATRLGGAQDAGGKDAVAVYIGNPTAHSYSATLFAVPLVGVLGTRNVYSSNSLDSAPRQLVSYLMYGARTILPIPDLDRTDLLLVLGANPMVSNGSVMTAPDCRGRLRALRERGGRLIVVDPRRTETADVADQHVFIRPGADAFLLLGMLHTIFAEKLARPGRMRAHCDDLERVGALVGPYPAERVAGVTGIDADTLRGLARTFASAEKAACYGRMGTCAQELGSVVTWLIDLLHLVTGNFDREGGAMFPRPAVDLSAGAALLGQSGSYDRYRSRVAGLPEVNGELPVATLPDEIETPGPGQVRAMLLHAGNPVLSAPNGRRMERALSSLELLVAIDLYVNETTRLAHYILPPAFGLEHDHYGLIFHAVAVRNTTKYSRAVVPPPEDVREDWRILLELATRVLGRRGALGRFASNAMRAALGRLGARGVLDALLRVGPHGQRPGKRGLTLDALADIPQGIDLGPLEPRLPGVLRTRNKRIRAVPAALVADLARVARVLTEHEERIGRGQLSLIGRRHLLSNNSWMHNTKRLVRGRERCTLLIHPDDARAAGVADGGRVSIASRVGSVDAIAEISAAMMPGTVSLPHGFGHGLTGVSLRVASERPGVSVNDVTDDSRMDTLSGTSALNGVPVTVRARP